MTVTLRIVFAIALLDVAAMARSDAQVGTSRHLVPPPAVARVIYDGAFAELLLEFGPRDSSDAKRRSFSYDIELSEVRTFETSSLGTPGAQVWIAFPGSVDHWHHYTVALLRSEVFRLGGFAAPELLALNLALGPAKGAEMQRAALLATLADPNGGVRLRLSDQFRIPLAGGHTLVRLTSESYQEHSYAAHYDRFAFMFLFSPSGTLLDWARNELRTQ